MAPPIEMVKLHIRTDYAESMADFCSLEVERHWLEQRIPADPNEIAQIVVGMEELTQWVRQTGVAHPLIGTYRPSGAHDVFSLNLAAMINHPDQFQFYVSVAGPIARAALHPHHHECLVHYGSVRVQVPEGFRSSFFGQQSSLTFAEWHRRLWSEPDVAVSGLAFGSRHCELELLNQSNRERRRVRLISRDGQRQLWQLSECGDGNTVRPDQVLREMKEATRQLLRGHNQSLRVSDQSVGGDRPPGVYYLREAELRTLIRPDFGIEFLGDGDGARSRVWLPRTLRALPPTQGATATLELNDSDEIAALEQAAVAAAPEEAILELTWDIADVGASREWRFSDVRYPDLVCIGAASAKLQDDYAWMFGNAMPQPPSLPEPMPGWTRLHLPDTSVAKASDNERALTIGTRSAESNWLFHLRPPEQSEIDPVNIKLTLKPSRIGIQMFRGDLSAASPVVSLYPRRLTAPQSPPNAKRLQGDWLTPPASKDERTKLASTRLTFAVKSQTGDDSDGQPRLEMPRDSRFLIVCKLDAAVAFAPYVRDAGIDFLSAGARNLEQSIDPRTMRPLVERDRTQTLTAFPIQEFFFGPSGTLRDVEYAASDAKVAAALALAPWVEMSDNADIQHGHILRRSLYHRNLALEHGEFAVASMDRSLDGTPMALANTVNDFIASVRDEYALAVDQLGGVEAAHEILHWVVSADLSVTPKAWLETLPPSADLLQRPPVVHLEPFQQQLQLGGPEQFPDEQRDWLTCDLRLQPLDTATIDAQSNVRPRVEVIPASSGDEDLGEHGSVRARNGSVPVLFDGGDFARCSADSRLPFVADTVGLLDWYVAVNRDGQHVIDRDTGQMLRRLAPPADALETSETMAIGNGATTATCWAVAIDSSGKAIAWTSADDAWASPGFAVFSDDQPADEAWVASDAQRVAVLQRARPDGEPRIWIWRVDDALSGDNPRLADPLPGLVPMQDWSLLFRDDEILIAGAPNNEPPQLWRLREQDDGSWSAVQIPNGAGLEGVTCDRLSLSMFLKESRTDSAEQETLLGMLDTANKTWRLAQIADEVTLESSVSFALLDESPTDILLAPRPQGTHGLPAGCRGGWIVIVHLSGAADIWLATDDDRLDSIDPQAGVLFAGMKHAPYYRLQTCFGTVSDCQPCFVNSPVYTVSGVPYRADSHAGWLTCGSDGAVRLIDLETGTLRSQCRDDRWTLDNLGTLRANSRSATGDVLVRVISRPDSATSARDRETSKHPPLGSVVAISRAGVPQQSSNALVRQGEASGALTDIHFSCEGLLLRKTVSGWAPEQIGSQTSGANQDVPTLAASRGFFGVFGFHSTVPANAAVGGLATRSTQYLPRIGGIPVFIDSIEEITFSESTGDSAGDSATAAPQIWMIESMSLRAALINPLLLDGAAAENSDYARGQLPPAIDQAIDENSIVQVQVNRVDGELHVIAVNSTSPLQWNTMSESATELSGGFGCQLERLTFDVRFDRDIQRIVLEVDADRSLVRTLGGSQPLASSAAPTALIGCGRDPLGKARYGFETAFENAPSFDLPLRIDRPIFDFNPEGSSPAAAGVATGDSVGVSTVVSWDGSRLSHWNSQTGLSYGQLTLEATIVRAAVGSAAAPTLICPVGQAGFLLGRFDLQLSRPDDQSLSRVAHEADVSVCCVVGDHPTYLVTGDISGQLRIWDMSTGSHVGTVALGAGRVSQLTGATHLGRPMVAALVDGGLAIVDVELGIVSHQQSARTPYECIDLRSQEGRLWVAAAGNSGSTNRPLLWEVADQKLLPAARTSLSDIGNIAIGYEGDTAAVIYTAIGHLRVATETVSDQIIAAASARSCVKFHEAGPAKHILVVATPQQPLRTLTRTNPGSGWGNWVDTTVGNPLPADELQLYVQEVTRFDEHGTSTTNLAAIVAPRHAESSATVLVLDTETGQVQNLLLASPSRNGDVPIAVGLDWRPHAAVVHELVIDVVDLHSGRSRASFPTTSTADVAFARANRHHWLVFSSGAEVQTRNVVHWTAAPTLVAPGDIGVLAAQDGIVLATPDTGGAIVWRVGESNDDANRLELLPDQIVERACVSRIGDSPESVALLQTRTDSHFLVRFQDDLNVDPIVTSVEFSELPRLVEFAWLDNRLHVLTLAGSESRAVDCWRLPTEPGADSVAATQRWRWLTGEPVLDVCLVGHGRGFRIVTASAAGLQAWAVDRYLQLNEQGQVCAETGIQPWLDEQATTSLGFAVEPRIDTLATLHLTQVANRRQPMVAVTQNQGMFCFLFNLTQPGGEAGAGSLVFWRNLDGSMTGSMVEYREHRCVGDDRCQLLFHDRLGQPHVVLAEAAFVSQTVLRLEKSEAARRWVQLSGSLRFSLGQSEASIVLVDQQVAIPEANSGADVDPGRPVVGYLDCVSGSTQLQGPIQLLASMANHEIESLTLKLAPCVYRAMPSVMPPRDDSIAVDVVLPAVGVSESRSENAWVALDLRIPTPHARSASFSVLAGDDQGLHLWEVEERRLPVDLCLDDEIRRPSAIAPTNVTQLAHLSGFGTRLRFVAEGWSTLDASPLGDELTGGEELLWLLQPLTNDGGQLRLLDASVAAVVRLPSEAAGTRTENVVAIFRPQTDEQPLVCLSSATGQAARESLIDSGRFATYQSNRWILLRHRQQLGDRPEMLRLDLPNQGVSAGSVPIQVSSSASAPRDRRRVLTHWESRNWQLDEQTYVILPDVARADRDQDRTAWREFVVGMPAAARQLQRETLPVEHSVLLQEATAFKDMPDPWLAPHPSGMVSLVEDLSESPSSPWTPTSFQPAELRVRLAADKPGAMVHHRFQFAARDLKDESETDDVPVQLHESFEVAIREPMQLNTPVGSSLQLLPDQCRARPFSNGAMAHVSFAWKETLGTVPVTATGECVIRQAPSQADEGAELADLRLELMPESRNCLQMIVQINDQLVDMGPRQPQFPVYDSRQAAKSYQQVKPQALLHRSYQPGLPSPHDVDVMESRRGAHLIHRSGTEVVVWSLSLLPPTLAYKDQTSNFSVDSLLTGATSGATAKIVADSDEGVSGILTLAEIRGEFLDGEALVDADGGEAIADGAISRPSGLPTGTPQTWLPTGGEFAALPHPLQWQGEPALMGAEDGKLTIWSLNNAGAPIDEIPAQPDVVAIDSDRLRHTEQGAERECFAVLQFGGASRIRIWTRAADNTLTSITVTPPDPQLAIDELRIRATGVGRVSLFAWSREGQRLHTWQLSTDEAGQWKPLSADDHAAVTLPALSLATVLSSHTPDSWRVLTATDDRTVAVCDRSGQTVHEIRAASTLQRIFVRRINGKHYLVASCERGIQLWELATGQLLRELPAASGGANAGASVASLGGRVVLASSSPIRAVEVHDLFLLNQTPPNVFLVTSLPDLGEIPRADADLDTPTGVPVKVKHNSATLDLHVRLKPVLMIESRTAGGVSVTDLAGVFDAPIAELDGRRLYQLNTNNQAVASTDRPLPWDTATSVRLAWRGPLLDGEDVFEPRTEVEVVYPDPSAVKRIQLVPFSATAPKCAAVLVVDELDESQQVERQVMQRTLMFGDAANATFGEGVLRRRLGKVQFAFETTDRDDVDTPLPQLERQRLGLILAKYFIDGQTLSDAVELTSPDDEG